MPAPPSEQEITDYFLFDLQEGYCDYYATTMVVMARSIGIPARLVMGYAQGEYDETTGGYIVTEASAHSWVEVYFPEIGWIEFEPTAGVPATEHPEVVDPLPIDGSEFSEKPTLFYIPPGWLSSLGWLGVFTSLGIIFVLFWFMSDTWRLRFKTPEVVLTTIYRRLYMEGKYL
ncbi:transglutaminase family protein, partial [Chloroflexota bacterium]